MHIELFGDFRICRDGKEDMSIHSPRMQALLAYLLLHHKAPQSRQYLSFLFWPESSEKQARTNLRHVIHHFKTALPEFSSCIAIEKNTLQWKAGFACMVDVLEFEQLLRQVKKEYGTMDSGRMRKMLESIIGLYQGDLLPACYENWICKYRDWFRLEFHWALEKFIHVLEEEGDYGAAILYAHKLLMQDNLCESAYANLMRLYSLHHDRAAALRVYDLCCTNLRKEMEVSPCQELQALYRQLLGEEKVWIRNPGQGLKG